jgi:hypothetical protein
VNRLTHVILAVGVFGLGWFAGGRLFIDKPAATSSTGADRRLAESTEANQGLRAIPKLRFATEEEMLTTVMSAVVEDDPLLRAHRLRIVLGNLSSAELSVFFQRILRVDDRDRRNAVLVPLIARWVALDAVGAKATVQPFLDRARKGGRMDWRSPEIAVNEAWAKALPEATLQEALATPDAPWAATAARAAIETFANGDAAQQLDAFSRFPTNRLRDELCGYAIRALAEEDFVAAQAQLDLISNPRQRSRLQADLLGQLAQRDPAAALDRMTGLSSSLGSGVEGLQLVNTVLRSAAKLNPADALAAIDDLPEAVRAQARGAALIGWADENPVAALEWAVANGIKISEAKALASIGEGGGSSWYSLISTAFHNDREKTLAWLRSQPASAERDSLLRSGLWNGPLAQRIEIYNELTPASQKEAVWSLVNGFAETDMSAAETWVKGLPVGDVRCAAVQNLAMRQADDTPERLDAFADAWPAGPEQDAALLGISNAVTEEDPKRGLDFAARISNPQTRFKAFAQIANSWLSSNESAARAWIARASEFTPDQKRVLIRQFDER